MTAKIAAGLEAAKAKRKMEVKQRDERRLTRGSGAP